MKNRSLLKYSGLFALASILIFALFLALFDWNWARGPIERFATEKTGRALAINGDLKITYEWFHPRIHASNVTFANPAWAKEKQMAAADTVEFTVDLLELLRGQFFLPEVRAINPVVFLEQGANGQKNWLLDIAQQNEDSRVRIERLVLDKGKLGYDDNAQKTSIRMDVSTQDAQRGNLNESGIVFSAQGKFKDLALKASGTGGSVLALHDENAAYPLNLNATVGSTSVQTQGTITSLVKFSAVDMQLALRGDSLEQLYPLIGLVLPKTNSYNTKGHIIHSGQMWRYEKFVGRIGNSDIAGTLDVDNGQGKPFLTGDLVSERLDFADLGPVIGTPKNEPAKNTPAAARPVNASQHVLPDIPFSTERWDKINADVKLQAKSILRAKALPIDNLVTRIKMQDSVLTLDPLNFGMAGGQLQSAVILDGRKSPIQANAKLAFRKIKLNQLFPTIELTKSGIGQINGEIDLTGTGSNVAEMLGTSNGKVGLVMDGGGISNLLMEMAGLDLWKIFQSKLDGETELTEIRCGVADFKATSGVLHTNALVFDTVNTNVQGSGDIDLGQGTLNLTLNPLPKHQSPLVLRSPLHIRGTFSKPDVQIDKGQLSARGLGAVALGAINPLLAVIPLIETGPGLDSDCGRLIKQAEKPASATPPQAGGPGK